MKEQLYDEKLGLMVFSSARELGEKVDEHLLKMYGYDKDKNTFIIPIKEIFFEDGHFKIIADATVRGKDLYCLTDVGNYSVTYNMHGFMNHASPNDLFQQLKDGIHACNNQANKINVIMPLLYNGRQHRREDRESLSCSASLAELESIRAIRSILTFDAHDPAVANGVHNVEFDNFNVTNTVLDNIIRDLSIDELKKVTFIAPDVGAMKRNENYLYSFETPLVDKDASNFNKKRDYNVFENGRYKIISHEYIGNDVTDRTVIIVDDILSSGGSLIDVIEKLKELKASHIYAIVTYALFTRGIEELDKLYREKKLSGIYTTNLSYIPEEYKNLEWLHVCDCSELLSNIIYRLHNDLSISSLIVNREESIMKLEKKIRGE